MSGTDVRGGAHGPGAGFAHLHVASSYSLRYGLASPAALAQRAGEMDMPALALTDRDGLYGAVKHAVACAEAGIAPVLGADMALDPGAGGGPAYGGGAGLSPQAPPRLRSESAARVTLLATGARGWASLCRLVSAAHQAGERGAPVVTPDLVAVHADGLVVLLGPASDVGRAVAARRRDRASAVLARWRERAEAVVEVIDHAEAGSAFRCARMLKLARDAGVPAVLTNAVRYLDRADGAAAQVLDAARQMVPLGRHHRVPGGGAAWLASGEDMAHAAARLCGAGPGAGSAAALLAATADLARRCALDAERDLGIGGRFMPETTGDAVAQLRAACEEGIVRRFGGTGSGGTGSGGTGSGGPGPGGGAARRRLEHELDIITKTGLSSYFLTVADVARRIAAAGIRCSIRGSGAGCLVNYLVGISEIDPLEHDLVMERFLSEHRNGLPDIDLDVESARRIEAYRVIFDAYGEQRVACVSMMETYRARSAIRDVAAALGLPPHETDALAKAFPHVRAAHIRGALAELPELRSAGLAIPQLRGLFQLAEHLDGLPRHVAMHPCGVVLSDVRLLDRTPVERSFEGLPLSQFDKDDVEVAGMVKLDVLGVRMQSAMAYTLGEVERTTGERVDIDRIDTRDEPTYEMIRAARTLGCFQIESPGQRELVGKLLPRDIGDLIVDISLFRPGPVNSDMVTPYLETRHGIRPPRYPHEGLAGALAETGGVVVFHEQVLRVIDTMTGCGLSYADVVRRGLGNEGYREWAGEWFGWAARAHGYSAAVVDRVWEVLAAFGAFGFCKAHAAAFAIPTYQSAWLKAHYPAAFYAGVLTHDPGMYPKRVIVADARLWGVPVLPMDVNACAGDWRVDQVAGRPGLRPGLREVKGISGAEVGRLVAGQPYVSLRDFWERAGVSRPITERLIQIGAFAPLYQHRATLPPSPAEGGGSASAPLAAGSASAPLAAGSASAPLAAGSASAPLAAGSASAPLAAGSASAPLAAGSASAPLAAGSASAPLAAGSASAPLAAGSASAPLAAGSALAPLAAGVTTAAPTRRDLLARLGVLDRRRSRLSTLAVTAKHLKSDGRVTGKGAKWAEGLQLDLGAGGDGIAEVVRVGELREMTATERVQAELEVLGIDLSQHVLEFYEGLLGDLGVVRSAGLRRCRAGERVLVAGVKVATQTPAVRSGQRIIFVTLDDATGPVDLAFFESVQGRCAARVFGSWLLAVQGRVRRAGQSVSVNGEQCWDLAALAEVHAAGGIDAVRAAMAAGDVPGPAAGAARRARERPPEPGGSAPGPDGGQDGVPKVTYPNGFTLSPYAETGAPGGEVKDAPRRLWHASPGSSGDWVRTRPET